MSLSQNNGHQCSYRWSGRKWASLMSRESGGRLSPGQDLNPTLPAYSIGVSHLAMICRNIISDPFISFSPLFQQFRHKNPNLQVCVLVSNTVHPLINYNATLAFRFPAGTAGLTAKYDQYFLLHKSNTIYFRCYTVHVVELLNYYTNYCTYIKFIILFIYLLQLGCHPVAVVIIHVNKT